MSVYDNLFSNFGRSPVPDDLCTDSAPRHHLFWRRRYLKGFTIYGHGGHLGQWTATILAIFRSPQLKKAQYEIWANLAQWLQRRSNLKFSTIFYSNVWGSYKCIGKQTWPCHKKVKCQRTTILLATLVDLLSPMICAKIHPKAFSVLEKKVFKGFYHIWAWRPSWSTDCDNFSNLLFPYPKVAPYEI